MRAREPDVDATVDVDGVPVHYEVFGTGAVTVVLTATFPVVDSRHWKAQVPYLARHFRVITIDPRGNGRSGRPLESDAYADDAYARDLLSVLDETRTESAFLVGLCTGVKWSMLLAADHPERVSGIVAIAPGLAALGDSGAASLLWVDDPPLRGDYDAWAAYHSTAMLAERHSSKVWDDLVDWALQTDQPTLEARFGAPLRAADEAAAVQLCRSVTCPVLVVHGTEDRCKPVSIGRRVAELVGGRFVEVTGAGHLPHARHPVLVNRLIKEFVDEHVPAPRQSAWLVAHDRRRRVLWVCSPIGLGHVLRDLAIARALREQDPELEVEWLAQPPVTGVLEGAGEIVHPASAELASESAHWESEAGHHDLHAFYAFRRMDEILCANYMLFDDVVRETPYDLWVGDESWEVDHFLHENPERKSAPYAFLTDVVGFLPVDAEGDPREAELCADYNAEMIEHRRRYPYVRDRSVFIGGFDELPDASFGPGLPGVREWTRQWFSSVPYVVPFEPSAYRSPSALRRLLGYGTDYPLYVAAVGGTAVGRTLLELTAEAFALVRRQQPDARMLMVTGPRLEPSLLPDVEGMDKVGYVPSLFEHLACADVAVVQGGLSTTMELVAARRPFVYFPLARHWEQQHFVATRLEHYRAGVRMDYASTRPQDLAAAMLALHGTRPAYRGVRRDGAARAARELASVVRRG